MSAGSENYLKLVKSSFDGELKLPAFQREFKWKRPQVVLLYDSIRQGYPLGSIILLEGGRKEFQERSFRGAADTADNADAKRLVLDGQQRITAGIDLFFGNSKDSNSQYFIDIKKLEIAIKNTDIDLDNDEDIQVFLSDLDTDTGYCQGRKRVADPLALLKSNDLICTRVRTHKMDSLGGAIVIHGLRRETIDESRPFLADRGAVCPA